MADQAEKLLGSTESFLEPGRGQDGRMCAIQRWMSGPKCQRTRAMTFYWCPGVWWRKDRLLVAQREDAGFGGKGPKPGLGAHLAGFPRCVSTARTRITTRWCLPTHTRPLMSAATMARPMQVSPHARASVRTRPPSLPFIFRFIQAGPCQLFPPSDVVPEPASALPSHS